MRTFIAIEIPEKIKEQIIQIQGNLQEFEGKLTEKENLHMTLKFLGEINEKKIEQIKEKLKEIKFKRVEVSLDKIGFFDNQYKGVIWIHLTNCENLQKEVDEKLKNLFPKEKRFMSHLTLARTKQISNKKLFLDKLEKIKIPPLNFQIKEFKLKESILKKDKPIYKDIEIYNLN